MSRTVGKEFVRAFKEEMEISVKLEKVQEALKGANVIWRIWLRWMLNLFILIIIIKNYTSLEKCHIIVSLDMYVGYV